MTDRSAANTWRVLTWNVRGSARPDLARIAAVVREQRPDVVAFQEIRRTQARSLARVLAWPHCWTRKHYPYSPAAWWLAEGLAILSPYPLRACAHRTLTPGVSTWTYRHRVVLAATVQRDDDALRIYDVHLAAHAHADERIAQADRVAAMMAEDDPSAAVVAGDLNAADESEVIRPFHRVGVRDPGGGPTHPSMAPRQRLDYILVPDSARVTDRFEPGGGDEWRELSDHVPALVEFALPDDHRESHAANVGVSDSR